MLASGPTNQSNQMRNSNKAGCRRQPVACVHEHTGHISNYLHYFITSAKILECTTKQESHTLLVLEAYQRSISEMTSGRWQIAKRVCHTRQNGSCKSGSTVPILMCSLHLPAAADAGAVNSNDVHIAWLTWLHGSLGCTAHLLAHGFVLLPMVSLALLATIHDVLAPCTVSGSVSCACATALENSR